MMNLGIDDAGRGPVVGPMILAGVLIDPKHEKELTLLGVKDSKQLTQKRRVFLAEKIKEVAEDFAVVITKATEIDFKSESGTNLNDLEAIKAAKIVNKLNKGKGKIKLIVDCPSTGIEKWKDFLKAKIEDLSNLNVACEHKADKNHVSVAAASILAKCAREEEMDKIREEYGKEIGSGYTSDPLTIKFLAKFAEKHQDKGIFRKTWKTWKRAIEKLGQRTLV
jgi:ribonuclease HII